MDKPDALFCQLYYYPSLEFGFTSDRNRRERVATGMRARCTSLQHSRTAITCASMGHHRCQDTKTCCVPGTQPN